MNVRHVCKWCEVIAVVALGSNVGLHKVLSAPPGPAGAKQGVQVLARGPVHEAFAETVTFDPQPGVVAPKAPPAAIEELPPGQKPEGVNVAWIPGYWGWDDERNDYLWVSGIWRALPPGRQWVPGYWGKSGQGFQWTSGYWANAKASEVEYLREPPATVEAGPNIATPSPDDTWLPGCWVWQNSRYAWRPGYWAPVQPNWVWVPAHYVWAPRGYVFVDGYWDYSIGRRGVLFAPVYFSAGVYARRGFSYSPTAVIDLGVFTNHLFLRPRYQHYYFGDYYAANYRGEGFYPWFSINTGRFGYDPIYAYDRWQHRQDRGWEQRQQADFENRRDHEDARPPRIWMNQGVIGRGGVASAVLNIVGASLDEAARSRNDGWRFQPVDEAERQRLAQQRQEIDRFRDRRQQWETNAAGGPTEARSNEFAPVKVRLPGSPIVAKPGADLGKDQAPPKTYEAPKPDPTVAARSRVNRSPEQPQERTVNRIPVEPPQPQPPPKAEGATPQPQAERAAPQPRGNAPAATPPAGAKQEQHKS